VPIIQPGGSFKYFPRIFFFFSYTGGAVRENGEEEKKEKSIKNGGRNMLCYIKDKWNSFVGALVSLQGAKDVVTLLVD
jgi:hypothetical protein